MLYQIMDGTVAAGGRTILNRINFEIKGNEKIAVVGKNGAGKTTLLRLIAGELDLERDDRRNGPGIATSRSLITGMLKQQSYGDGEQTVEALLEEACPYKDAAERERFFYEKEYDTLFTGFGFSKEDKKKKISMFSGGEQTKIGLIALLLEKPDILLLDEPTNHLDIQTVEWLEQYLKHYEKAVVMVSHDRFFLDRTAEAVYEISGGKLARYAGNYTEYRQQKLKHIAVQRKNYEQQQEEIKRLSDLIERFKHKPNKASFARAKKKTIERMEKVPAPQQDDVHLFTGEIVPLITGSKWVLEAEHVKIGYEKVLLELSLRVKRGQKIGILGDNGVGKTTFLKTAAGFAEPLSGKLILGNQITIGYFDQNSAAIQSDLTVLEHFHKLFPGLTDKEVRTVLGGYLFGGRDAGKRVSDLSGGEKARLVLAELLQSRPNFLILDEPTNHMDIQAKETLESAFQSYTGTILFVSHDRYFIRQVAQSVLIFEGQSAMYYPFGYEHYLERSEKQNAGDGFAARMQAEEQALVAGLKAVPKADRHRLKEISTEEAYKDWKIRLAGERLAGVSKAAGQVKGEMERTEELWLQSEACMQGVSFDDWIDTPVNTDIKETDYKKLAATYEQLEEQWTAICLEWYDLILEEERSEAAHTGENS